MCRETKSPMRGRLSPALACLLLVPMAAAAQATATEPGFRALGAEALYWRFSDSPVPVPFVTDGLVGQPGTRTFLGGQDVDTGSNPGFRLSGLYALDGGRGLEGIVFHLPSRSTSTGISSSGQPGSPEYLIPFLDANTNAESSTELSYPPIYGGTATQEFSNSLLGAELNVVDRLAPQGGWRLERLGGLRYLRLRETLTLTTASPLIAPFPKDVWETTDRFDTTNDFYGLQAGLRGRFEEGRLFAEGVVKVAVGAMAQKADVSGSLVTNDFNGFGATQTFAGGYFALPTNIGAHSRTAFAVVPEVGLSVGYRVTSSVSLLVGYTCVYASSVVRPGRQVDRTINPTQSPAYSEDPDATLSGPAQPSFRFDASSFRAQGVSAGLAIRF